MSRSQACMLTLSSWERKSRKNRKVLFYIKRISVNVISKELGTAFQRHLVSRLLVSSSQYLTGIKMPEPAGDAALSLARVSAHTHGFSLRPCSQPGTALAAEAHRDPAQSCEANFQRLSRRSKDLPLAWPSTSLLMAGVEDGDRSAFSCGPKLCPATAEPWGSHRKIPLPFWGSPSEKSWFSSSLLPASFHHQNAWLSSRRSVCKGNPWKRQSPPAVDFLSDRKLGLTHYSRRRSIRYSSPVLRL